MLPIGDQDEVETFMDLMKKWLKLSKTSQPEKQKQAQVCLLQVWIPLS